MKIRILEDHVVDRIAAGEVVERPASVLKELLENALDAGARRVTIHLERGGTGLVRVVDDGEGMTREDALLAIERHATSKIRSDEDLAGVATLGFRGEALPSIASVSRFSLKTRRAEAEVGHALSLEGGRLEGVREVAMPPGTDIAARSLFFNTPARRRFLRTVPTELTHCLDLVRREVMMRPGLDVTVRHDGREVLRSSSTEDGARAVADLLGRDVEGALRRVEHTLHGVRVHGWAADPTVTRSSATQAVFLWVGGRVVKDPLLRRAVLDAGRARRVSGRYPVVVIAVDVAPGEVDVNVHPAKTEVRFRRPREVSEAVSRALTMAWSGARASPREQGAGQIVSEAPDLFRTAERSAPAVEAMPAVSGPPSLDPLAGEPSRSRTRDEPPSPLSPDVGRPSSKPTSPAVPAAPRRVEPSLPVVVHAEGGVIVTRHEGSLWLIDASAERARDPGPSRPLLVPRAVSLGPEALRTVLDGAEALEGVGIGVRAFSPGQVALTATPEGVSADDAAGLVRALAGALERGDPLGTVLAERIEADPARHAELAASALASGTAVRVSPDMLRRLMGSAA